MSHDELFTAWYRIANWCAYKLVKDGYQGVVLQPPDKLSKASIAVARDAGHSENDMHRKSAASLVEWMRDSDPSLPGELFRSDTDLDAQLNSDDPRRLDTHSIVEDIVSVAARWAHFDQLESAALALFSNIVQRTLTANTGTPSATQ